MGELKGDKRLNNVGLIPKIPKIQRPKALRIDVVSITPCRLTPYIQETPREYPHKTYIAEN